MLKEVALMETCLDKDDMSEAKNRSPYKVRRTLTSGHPNSTVEHLFCTVQLIMSNSSL